MKPGNSGESSNDSNASAVRQGKSGEQSSSEQKASKTDARSSSESQKPSSAPERSKAGAAPRKGDDGSISEFLNANDVAPSRVSSAALRPGGKTRLRATRSLVPGELHPASNPRRNGQASGAKGSVVVGPGGLSPSDGCTFMIRMDFPVSPGFGKAYRSVKSSRASPCGKLKSGPE